MMRVCVSEDLSSSIPPLLFFIMPKKFSRD